MQTGEYIYGTYVTAGAVTCEVIFLPGCQAGRKEEGKSTEMQRGIEGERQGESRGRGRGRARDRVKDRERERERKRVERK